MLGTSGNSCAPIIIYAKHCTRALCHLLHPVACMHSYQLAESVDGQLRRMEQDLKEVIEQMNSSNTAEDEDSPVR